MSVVASIPNAEELRALTVEERLRLLDEVWESLAARPDQIPLPEWHLAEVRHRASAYEAERNPGRPADAVSADLKRLL